MNDAVLQTEHLFERGKKSYSGLATAAAKSFAHEFQISYVQLWMDARAGRSRHLTATGPKCYANGDGNTARTKNNQKEL